MDSENLSSLIRLSVSDGQKTDSSKVVSVIGIIKNGPVRIDNLDGRSMLRSTSCAIMAFLMLQLVL